MEKRVYKSCNCKACNGFFDWYNYTKKRLNKKGLSSEEIEARKTRNRHSNRMAFHKNVAHRKFRQLSRLYIKKGIDYLPVVSTGYLA